MDKKTLEHLLKIVLKNNSHINNIGKMLSDHNVVLLSGGVELCACCEKNPSTVQHTKRDIKLCDRCCAEVIVAAKKNIRTHAAKMDLLVKETSGESSWVDTRFAQSVRRMCMFLEQLELHENDNHEHKVIH